MLAALKTFSMLRPTRATFRPWRSAAVKICCRREVLEEKVATKMRPLAPSNICAMVSPTWRSDLVKPGTSMLVDSQTKSSTPSRPSWAMRCRFMISPLMGV